MRRIDRRNSPILNRSLGLGCTGGKMSSSTILRCTLAWLVVLAASGPRAAGQVITYDGFNYASGSNLNGLNGGTGWATAWSEPNFGTGNPIDNVPETIQTGSLSLGSLSTTGNRVV